MERRPLYRDTPLGGRLTPFKGQWPAVPDSAYIFHGAQVVGNVTLGEGVSVWHNCVLRGDVNHIMVGDRTNIQDGTVIHVSTRTFPTMIGRDCLIAHMAMLHGCTLRDRAFVGMGAMVMDNCIIEEDGMLAAGAQLTPGKTVGSQELWAGCPAKFVRPVTDAELAKNRGMAEHYRLLAEQHKADAEGRAVDKAYP